MTLLLPAPVNRGSAAISMGIVLAIVMIAAPLGFMRYSAYMEERSWDVMAMHMSTVSLAAQHYVRDNHDALATQANGGPVLISCQTLRDNGYLPSGFSLNNNEGQSYLLSIARDPKHTTQLVAFVLTTGGQPLAFRGLRYIAQGITGMGGYLWPDNVASGADGGWQMRLPDYGLSGQSGHLASYLSADILGGESDESDRLYRFKVNGRPDLNKMHTDIDMGSNSLNNANAINARTVTSENDIKSNNGWIVTEGSKGWINQTHGGGFYMDDDDWVKSVNGKGIMTAGKIRAEGRLSTNDVIQMDQINISGTACSLNGLLSRDEAGQALSCINRKWSYSGSGWKLPSPQTVSCTIKHEAGQYAYTNIFEAKVESDGSFWAREYSNGETAAWVRNEYVDTTHNKYMPTVATVTIAGLTGHDSISICDSSSHNQNTCTTPSPASCYAPWSY